MKYKADILLSQNHKYIVMLPIQKKRNTHYLLKTPTNQLVIQPYLNTEDETIKIGRELASILTIKQYEEIEVEPFTGEILSLEILYIKIKQPFDHSKLSNLEFINSLDTKQFEIDLGDDVYKMENTKIYYSNCDLKKVYGHKNDITNIQKLAYGSLFCKNEINGFNLKQSNVMIVKGNMKLRLNDIMHNVAHNLHANYYFMPTDVQSIPSENIMYVYEFDESSIYSTIHNVKKYEQDNVLFVFLVNDDEHKEKLLAYFDTSLSYDVSVPVAKRDGKLLKELLCEIPHKINEKEMRSLVSYLCNKNLFEIEDIITRVLSKANYEKRFDMKTGGCFVVYSDFMEVLEKLQKTKTTGLFASARQWIRKRFL